MMQKDLLNFYEYLKNWNNQFSGELIDDSKLTDLFDNIEDIDEEIEELSTHSLFLSTIKIIPTTWDMVVEDTELMGHEAIFYANLLDFSNTIEDIRQIYLEMNEKYLKLIGAPEE